MKEKIKKIIIIGIIVIILVFPIILDYIKTNSISIKSYEEFSKNISTTTFSLVYYGDTNTKDYKPYKQTLIDLKKEYKIDVYSIDNKTISQDNRSKLISLNSEFKNENVYAIIRDGELLYINSNRLTKEDLIKLIDKYNNNIIPEDEIAYKTVSTYKEYMKIVNSKEITMAVFGRNSCAWCNRFKPIYNEVAAENNLNIYYFDSDSFDSNEYGKILNSGLMIPASCNNKGTDIPLSSGFGTPLTLFTKEGKVIDCISGYANKTSLLTKLKSVGLI